MFARRSNYSKVQPIIREKKILSVWDIYFLTFFVLSLKSALDRKHCVREPRFYVENPDFLIKTDKVIYQICTLVYL